jgi:hypothetical protein
MSKRLPGDPKLASWMSGSDLKYRLLLVGLLLLAFTLRVAAIDKLPAGLSHDEAYNGVTALQVMAGEWRIFFEINKGIEPLIIYLEALAFQGFGIGPVQMRLVNIFFGMLTVALVYPFTARLLNRQVALLAMAGLAVSFWAVFTSRLSLRATLFPPLLLLTLYLFWHGLNPDPKHQATSWIFFGLSGVAAGLTMYTYLSSRFVPLLVLAIFGYQTLKERFHRGQNSLGGGVSPSTGRGDTPPPSLFKQRWLGLCLHFLAWSLLFAPLANYYLQNPESFSRRADQVSTLPHLLAGNAGPLLKNTGRTLGMFTFQGDTTDRYNLNGRPVFDWGNGLLFYLGLGLVVWPLLRTPLEASSSALLLATLFFMLLPGFITDDSPHFLRTIGAMPMVYILWALGLGTMCRWLSQKLKGHSFSSKGLYPYTTFIVVSVLILTTLHTGFDYFWRWATAPEARQIYGADIAEVARYLKSAPDQELTVISAEYYRDLDPFRFALHFQGRPPFVLWFDGRQSLAFPPQGSSISPRYIFPASAPPADIWTDFLQLAPAESGTGYQIYYLPAEANLQQFQTTLQPVKAGSLQGELVLLGYKILGEVVSGGKVNVLLAWQALRTLPPGTDYTFLVQLRDRQQHLWEEIDGNGYDADDWQPGVQALQLLTLRLPGDLPPQTYQLTAAVINRQTQQALPTSSGETNIPLTTIKARLATKPRIIEADRLPNPIQLATTPPDGAAELALRGYQLSSRTIHSGEELSVTLHWQALEQPQADYQLQFSLQDYEGRLVYAWPWLEPVNGEWPTSQWPAHYWIQDKLSLPVGAEIPAGAFKLQAAWIAPQQPIFPLLSPEGFGLGDILVSTKE